MKFGIFDHMDRSGAPFGEQYESRLQLIEAYDRGGFYAYHVAEHHGTPLGYSPSPSVFLAAVAQRTKRLHFGPLVYLLPLYHPLRLIEEICMLDQMSGGRFELGVGRGVSPHRGWLLWRRSCKGIPTVCGSSGSNQEGTDVRHFEPSGRVLSLQ
jgi:alkanesulfonate monooxygenase SsuD/methylene tetrahydromethanopterin reductase-like flavin-dependent oxidoreductase (luciferase family)